MANKNFSDQELEKILNSLDGIQKAAPQPFLYTRLVARMQQVDDNPWSRVLQFVSKPAFAMGMALLFLMINGYILFNQYSEQSEPAEETTQALALEYTSLTSPFYDNNEENP
jgi:hypothetical protein